MLSTLWRCYRCISKNRIRPTPTSVSLSQSLKHGPSGPATAAKNETKAEHDRPAVSMPSEILNSNFPKGTIEAPPLANRVTAGENVTEDCKPESAHSISKPPTLSVNVGRKNITLHQPRPLKYMALNDADQLKSIDFEDLDKLVLQSVKPKATTRSPKQSSRPGIAITASGISNTPSQLTSPVESASVSSGHVDQGSPGQSDPTIAPLIFDAPKPVKNLSSVTLCSACKSKRVLARRMDRDPLW